jgi:hypothetical protein
VVSIDAASIAVDTPGTASSSGRSSKQFNPLREAALRPGEVFAAIAACAQSLNVFQSQLKLSFPCMCTLAYARAAGAHSLL